MKHLRSIVFFSFAIFYNLSFGQIINTDNRFLFEPQKSFATNEKKIDSLKKLILNASNDTSKVLYLIALSNEQSNDIVNASTEYAERAILLAGQLQYGWGLAMAHQALGLIFQNRKDHKTAVYHYQLAIKAVENAADFTRINFYSPLLNLYFYLGDYPDAMKAVNTQLEIFEKIKFSSGIAQCNNLLGYIYLKQENFINAEEHYSRYLENAIILNDSIMVAHALGEMSDVYAVEKKYDQSILALSIALKMLGATSRSKSEYTRGQTQQMQAKAFYRLGKVYKEKGNLLQALKYSVAAVDSSIRNSTNVYEKAAYFINAGDVYKDLKQYDRAIDYLRFGFSLSKNIQHRENIRDAANYLSQTYALQNNADSAFFYYKLFVTLKDSIVNNETKLKINAIQSQYDIAKKDKEISRQNQLRNVLIGSFTLLLIFLSFLYRHKQLTQKNNYQHQLSLQQNDLFNAIAGAQDQERKRIAQDIHDSLGSLLSAAKLKLSALNDDELHLNQEQQQDFKFTLQLLDEASSELRNISQNIMPVALSKLGLVAALKNLTGIISSHSGLKINFTTHDFNERLNEQMEMSIYRIVLELINNVVKHAKAKRATIQLIRYPQYFNLLVEDNGQGFDYSNAVLNKKGLGLGNILSRVNFLKGKIHVDATLNRGTTVIIEIPMNSPEA